MVEAKHAPRGPEVGLLLLKLRKSTVVGVPQGPPAACFSLYYYRHGGLQGAGAGDPPLTASATATVATAPPTPGGTCSRRGGAAERHTPAATAARVAATPSSTGAGSGSTPAAQAQQRSDRLPTGTSPLPVRAGLLSRATM